MRNAFVGFTGAMLGLLVAGCSVQATSDGYAYSDRLNIARDEYHARKEYCEQMGGSMSLRSQPLAPPGLTEYRSARCVRR